LPDVTYMSKCSYIEMFDGDYLDLDGYSQYYACFLCLLRAT